MKTQAFLLSFLIFVGVLSGCGDGGSSSSVERTPISEQEVAQSISHQGGIEGAAFPISNRSVPLGAERRVTERSVSSHNRFRCGWKFNGKRYRSLPKKKVLAVSAVEGEVGYAGYRWKGSLSYWKRYIVSRCQSYYGEKCVVYDLNGNVCNVGRVELTLTSPRSGATLRRGKTYTIKWKKRKSGSSVRLYLDNARGKRAKWIKIRTANDGNHKWKVPRSLKEGVYTLRLESRNTIFIWSSKKIRIKK